MKTCKYNHGSWYNTIIWLQIIRIRIFTWIFSAWNRQENKNIQPQREKWIFLLKKRVYGHWKKLNGVFLLRAEKMIWVFFVTKTFSATFHELWLALFKSIWKYFTFTTLTDSKENKLFKRKQKGKHISSFVFIDVH